MYRSSFVWQWKRTSQLDTNAQLPSSFLLLQKFVSLKLGCEAWVAFSTPIVTRFRCAQSIFTTKLFAPFWKPKSDL